MKAKDLLRSFTGVIEERQHTLKGVHINSSY